MEHWVFIWNQRNLWLKSNHSVSNLKKELWSTKQRNTLLMRFADFFPLTHLLKNNTNNNSVKWLNVRRKNDTVKEKVHQATCRWSVNYLASCTSLKRTLNGTMYRYLVSEYNLFQESSKNSWRLLSVIILYYFLTAEMSQNGFLFEVVLLHSLIQLECCMLEQQCYCRWMILFKRKIN